MKTEAEIQKAVADLKCKCWRWRDGLHEFVPADYKKGLEGIVKRADRKALESYVKRLADQSWRCNDNGAANAAWDLLEAIRRTGNDPATYINYKG